jgi:phosphate transport system substrate-binding protein
VIVTGRRYILSGIAVAFYTSGEMKVIMFKRTLLIVIALVLTLTACGSNAVAPTGAANNTSGAATSAVTAAAANASTDGTSISFSGGFALYPLVQRWTEEYSKLHPEIKFDVQAGGAGKGMTDVLAGAVNVAMLTREIRKEETDKGAVAIPVAIDAVVFTINANNPVAKEIAAKGLTKDQLARIFIKGDKLTWGELLGTDNKSAISVYTRADAAGAAEQAAKYLGAKAQDDLKGIGVQGDPGLLEAIRKDTNGIGYNNYNFAYDLSTSKPLDSVGIVPLDQDGNGKVDDGEAVYATTKELTVAIAAHKYPWPPSRELFLVTKGAPTGAVKDFIKWALSDGQAFIDSAGYVAIPADKLTSALESLK